MTRQFASKNIAVQKKKALAARLLEQLAHGAAWRPGERAAVAVSGGADSVALLLLLLELREKLGMVVSVAHLNHKLRGRASDGDEKFVARLAAEHQLDFHVEHCDVAAKAKREKANLEDAARRARSDFFSRLVLDKKVGRVAVAHTADDQAETVLAHILRGTGLAGLGGIHPETESVIRPLLRTRRAELRAYLRAKKQKWREDATNQDTLRLRARIRKKLLPLLEKQFQPAVVEHLGSLAEFAREDEALLEVLAAQRCKTLARKTSGAARVELRDLLQPETKGTSNTEAAEDTEKAEARRALTKRVLQRLIQESKNELAKNGGAARNAQITAQHIAAVLELAQHGESGKKLQLPGGVEVRRERDALVFCKLERMAFHRSSTTSSGKPRDSRQSRLAYEHRIQLSGGNVSLRFATPHCVLRFTVIDWPENRVETRESGAVLDRGRLRFPLVLRNWRAGDKLHPAGHQKAQKLKRLFNEKRISRWERQGWPVLASGDTLVWARGFPVNAEFAATEETREAVVIAEES